MPGNNSMLIIQDDVWAGSLHLDEVLLSAIPEAEDGAAAFAFATKDGLSAIFGSEEFLSYCRKGHHFDLYIGVDSVTTPEALEFAVELSERLNGKLNVRVYYDDSSSSIFHAKTTWLRNPGGEGCIAFVGSGNLTRAGLQKNVEMFSWIEQDRDSFAATLGTWNGWVEAAREAGRLWRADDGAILERAGKNRFSRPLASRLPPKESVHDKVIEDSGAVVVSQMPLQRGRGWGQFVMSKEFFEGYFGFETERREGLWRVATDRRILLRSVSEDGTVGTLESRAGNVSGSSSNYRIELSAGRKLDDSDTGKNFVVFVKVGDREFLYQISPHESVWAESLEKFAVEHKGKAKGNPKCRVSLSAFEEAFPGYPLLAALGKLNKTEEWEG